MIFKEEAGYALEIAIEKPEWQTMEQLLKAKTAFDIKQVFMNVLLAV
jgi:hypothetical protein